MNEYTDTDGDTLWGHCGFCGIEVDNYDANHRVTSVMRGGKGVECVLRGDITPSDARPLGRR